MWHKWKQQGVRNVFYPAQKNASLLDVQGKDKKIKKSLLFSSFKIYIHIFQF